MAKSSMRNYNRWSSEVSGVGKFFFFGLAAVGVDFLATEALFAAGVSPLFAKSGGYFVAFVGTIFVVGPLVFGAKNSVRRVYHTSLIYVGSGLLNLSVFQATLTSLPSRQWAFLAATVTSALINYVLLRLPTVASLKAGGLLTPRE